MNKDLKTNTTKKDIEKAKIQIEEIEQLEYICKEYDLCVFYDEYSNDEEGRI